MRAYGAASHGFQNLCFRNTCDIFLGETGLGGGSEKPLRERQRVGYPEAVNCGSFYISFPSMGVGQRGKGDAQRTGMDLCVVYGRIGGFRCGLNILLSLPLVSE